MPRYIYESLVQAAPSAVFAWHERPGAFERLAPPWADVEVVEREGGIRNGDRVVIRVSKGPFDFSGEVRHLGYEEGRQFKDEQVRGPFSAFLHTHIFREADGGGCLVRDEVEWEPPLGATGNLLSAGVVQRELSRVFPFRHERLRNDLELHGRFPEHQELTVAISGASGFIGSALRSFLTSGGHRVVPMVRQRGKGGKGAVFWDWRTGEIDERALEQVDAVVHLAGEPLVGLRWTKHKRREIYESRIKSTELISRTMAGLHSGPSTLVCASAVGYYGNRGDEIVTEESRPGRGFLADVCKDWESASARAERSGVRVVRLRMGFVVSPAGGALGKLLLPFKAGVGGRMGSGRQYVSWIDSDDVLGIIHHALMRPDVKGSLNLTAPNPVPQATFASTLGRVLARPTFVPVPGFAVKAALGQMGEETLLHGQRVKPARTKRVGYQFLYEGLEESFRHKLGRTMDPSSAKPG